MGRNTPNEDNGLITPRDRNITFERSTEFVVPYNEIASQKYTTV